VDGVRSTPKELMILANRYSLGYVHTPKFKKEELDTKIHKGSIHLQVRNEIQRKLQKSVLNLKKGRKSPELKI
jgi:hypothetical protein